MAKRNTSRAGVVHRGRVTTSPGPSARRQAVAANRRAGLGALNTGTSVYAQQKQARVQNNPMRVRPPASGRVHPQRAKSMPAAMPVAAVASSAAPKVSATTPSVAAIAAATPAAESATGRMGKLKNFWRTQGRGKKAAMIVGGLAAVNIATNRRGDGVSRGRQSIYKY